MLLLLIMMQLRCKYDQGALLLLVWLLMMGRLQLVRLQLMVVEKAAAAAIPASMIMLLSLIVAVIVHQYICCKMMRQAPQVGKVLLRTASFPTAVSGRNYLLIA